MESVFTREMVPSELRASLFVVKTENKEQEEREVGETYEHRFGESVK